MRGLRSPCAAPGVIVTTHAGYTQISPLHPNTRPVTYEDRTVVDSLYLYGQLCRPSCDTADTYSPALVHYYVLGANPNSIHNYKNYLPRPQTVQTARCTIMVRNYPSWGSSPCWASTKLNPNHTGRFIPRTPPTHCTPRARAPPATPLAYCGRLAAERQLRRRLAVQQARPPQLALSQVLQVRLRHYLGLLRAQPYRGYLHPLPRPQL